MNSFGNPSGNVGNARVTRTPAISQCPEVVSFPLLTSRARPQAPATGPSQAYPVVWIFPSPIPAMFGSSGRHAAITCPSVLDPASPYSAASGASPAPTASSTVRKTRLICLSPLVFSVCCFPGRTSLFCTSLYQRVSGISSFSVLLPGVFKAACSWYNNPSEKRKEGALSCRLSIRPMKSFT